MLNLPRAVDCAGCECRKFYIALVVPTAPRTLRHAEFVHGACSYFRIAMQFFLRANADTLFLTVGMQFFHLIYHAAGTS
jgi:hypothetical protein